MDGLLVLAVLGAVLTGVWWWMLCFRPIYRLAKGRPTYVLGLQVHLFLLILAVITRPQQVPLYFLAPWTLPFDLSSAAWDFWHVLAVPFLVAVATTLVSAVAIAHLSPKLRRFSPILAACIGLVLFFVTAEVLSRIAMKQAVVRQHGTCLDRRNFAATVVSTGDEVRTPRHAVTRINGTWHGWSYSQMQFYPLPKESQADFKGLERTCPAQLVAD